MVCLLSNYLAYIISGLLDCLAIFAFAVLVVVILEIVVAVVVEVVEVVVEGVGAVVVVETILVEAVVGCTAPAAFALLVVEPVVLKAFIEVFAFSCLLSKIRLEDFIVLVVVSYIIVFRIIN
jgi:hypothetical protein